LLLAHYQHYDGAATDRVMWRALLAPPRYNPKNIVDFALTDLDAESAEPVQLRAYLWGTSDLDESPDHHWRLNLNGTRIGDAVWDGTTPHVFESEVLPAGALHAGENRLGFNSLLAGRTPDAALLDWIEATYTARLDGTAEPLEFVAAVDEPKRYEVSGVGEHPLVYTRQGAALRPTATAGRWQFDAPE